MGSAAVACTLSCHSSGGRLHPSWLQMLSQQLLALDQSLTCVGLLAGWLLFLFLVPCQLCALLLLDPLLPAAGCSVPSSGMCSPFHPSLDVPPAVLRRCSTSHCLTRRGSSATSQTQRCGSWPRCTARQVGVPHCACVLTS